jgi:hypothetical protein
VRSRAASVVDLLPAFHPENELERRLDRDSRLVEGLAWGRPRKGHPEGAVANHVAHLLETIDDWAATGTRRADLRFISLVHDAFKHAVKPLRPKSGENHHAMRARRFAEEYTDDERLLATIELHDRPYGLWRRRRWTAGVPGHKVDSMLARIPDLELFVRFVELDGSTEGKTHAPIEWFREEIRRRGLAPGA